MKYVVFLVVGPRARQATSSCATKKAAFDACYEALDLTYAENPFDTFYEDDGLPIFNCADANANFDDRCANGPAACPAQYAAWVECGYADLAETWGLDCEGFTYDCPRPQPTPAPTAEPTFEVGLELTSRPTPRPTLRPSLQPTTPRPTNQPTSSLTREPPGG